jgi:hypothetical protein
MICGTVHSLAAMPASVLAVSLLSGGSEHTLTTPRRRLARIDRPWGTIYPSSLRSDSECEECIWILQS